jgi:hypothetical protein
VTVIGDDLESTTGDAGKTSSLGIPEPSSISLRHSGAHGTP